MPPSNSAGTPPRSKVPDPESHVLQIGNVQHNTTKFALSAVLQEAGGMSWWH